MPPSRCRLSQCLTRMNSIFCRRCRIYACKLHGASLQYLLPRRTAPVSCGFDPLPPRPSPKTAANCAQASTEQWTAGLLRSQKFPAALDVGRKRVMATVPVSRPRAARRTCSCSDPWPSLLPVEAQSSTAGGRKGSNPPDKAEGWSQMELDLIATGLEVWSAISRSVGPCGWALPLEKKGRGR